MRLHLDSAFSKEIREELYLLTMAGRWWLAYVLSGDNPKVLEALFEDAETCCRDQGIHDLAVFEDGSAINWHEAGLYVYWDISHLLEHYDQFRLNQIEPFEEALLDYPVLEKYRSVQVDKVARFLNLTIDAVPLGEKVSGLLFVNGERGAIGYNSAHGWLVWGCCVEKRPGEKGWPRYLSRRSSNVAKSENNSGRRGAYRLLFLPNGAEVIESVSGAIPHLRQVPGPACRRGHSVLCRRLCQWHDGGAYRTGP